MGSIHSMPICSHINIYSLTLKWHFGLLWPLQPFLESLTTFFQLLNMHLNIFNRGASSKVTIILAVSINKIAILGAKNGRLLNRERIVCRFTTLWKEGSFAFLRLEARKITYHRCTWVLNKRGLKRSSGFSWLDSWKTQFKSMTHIGIHLLWDIERNHYKIQSGITRKRSSYDVLCSLLPLFEKKGNRFRFLKTGVKENAVPSTWVIQGRGFERLWGLSWV